MGIVCVCVWGKELTCLMLGLVMSRATTTTHIYLFWFSTSTIHTNRWWLPSSSSSLHARNDARWFDDDNNDCFISKRKFGMCVEYSCEIYAQYAIHTRTLRDPTKRKFMSQHVSHIVFTTNKFAFDDDYDRRRSHHHHHHHRTRELLLLLLCLDACVCACIRAVLILGILLYTRTHIHAYTLSPN